MRDKETFKTIKEFLRKAGALMLALFLALSTVPTFAVMAEEPEGDPVPVEAEPDKEGQGEETPAEVIPEAIPEEVIPDPVDEPVTEPAPQEEQPMAAPPAQPLLAPAPAEENKANEFYVTEENTEYALMIEGLVTIDGGPYYETGYEDGYTMYSQTFTLEDPDTRPAEASAFERKAEEGLDEISNEFTNKAKSASLSQWKDEGSEETSDKKIVRYDCIDQNGALIFSDGQEVYGSASDFNAKLGDVLYVTYINNYVLLTETLFLEGEVEPYLIQMLANGDGGSVETDFAYAMAGDDIEISATPNEGYEFDEWEILEGPEVDFDKSAASTGFTMPNSDLKLQANFKEEEPEKYDIWVFDVQVTDENKDDIFEDGTASFDPETNTLTVNNPPTANTTYGIYSSGMDLTIAGSFVSGTNTYGIYVENGTLNLPTGTSLAVTGISGGIYVGGDLNVDGAMVTAASTGRSSSAVYSEGSITVSDGEVSANASGFYSNGIVAADSMLISGGIVNSAGGSYGSGVYAVGSIAMFGGYVNARGNDRPGMVANGAFVDIAGGEVVASGTNGIAVPNGAFSASNDDGNFVKVTANASGVLNRAIEADDGCSLYLVDINTPRGGYINWAGNIVTRFGLIANEVILVPDTAIRHDIEIATSSIDGEVPGESIFIRHVDDGTSLGDALEDAGFDPDADHFELDGYIEKYLYTTEPLSSFSSWEEAEAAAIDLDTEVTEDMTIYALMEKIIPGVELSIEAPVCGDLVRVGDITNPLESQTNAPFLGGDCNGYHFLEGSQGNRGFWCKDGDVFEGTIEGEEVYEALVDLEADFGYTFPRGDQDVEFDIAGGGLSDYIRYDGGLVVIINVEAVHDYEFAMIKWSSYETAPTTPIATAVYTCTGDASHKIQISKESEKSTVDPSCTEDGYERYDVTFTADETPDGQEISGWTRGATIPKFGHLWGEWEIIKQPTKTERGLKQHECARCGEIETEEIPMLDKDITIHFSSVDGDDLVDPIVISASEGMTLNAALRAADMSIFDRFFELDGYARMDALPVNKTISAYEDMIEVYADQANVLRVVENDMDLYVLMAKELDKVEVKIDAPLCGDEVIIRNRLAPWLNQEGAPKMATANDHYHFIDVLPPFFIADAEADNPYDYFITGGKDYKAYASIMTDFGYTFIEGAEVVVVGGEAVEEDCSIGGELAFLALTVTAEHSWSEWEVVKEPTAYEEGLEQRICFGCGEEETRVLEKISYRNTKGNGNVWVKGSTEVSSFEFKRSENDETTYRRFVKALVDGKELPASAYSVAPGSLIINLKPAYLETLAVGEHTLTVLFNDGDSSAKFTVTKKAEPAPAPAPVNPDKPSKPANNANNTKKPNANTGDANNSMFWFSAMIAAFGLAFMAFVIRKEDEEAEEAN